MRSGNRAKRRLNFGTALRSVNLTSCRKPRVNLAATETDDFWDYYCKMRI